MPRFKQYTLADVNRVNAKELRKEYTRMRHYAESRLEGLSEFAAKGYTIANKQYKPGYKMNAAELRAAMVDVSRFLNNPLSHAKNLARYESEQIAKLNRHGVPVTEKNFAQFTKFMEEYREQNLDKLFDSKQTAEAWQAFKKYKVSPEELAKHMNEFKNRKLSMKQAIVLASKRKTSPVASRSFRRKMGIK